MQIRAERIKKTRNDLGLSVEQFAQVIGVSLMTVHKWEHRWRDSEKCQVQAGAARLIMACRIALRINPGIAEEIADQIKMRGSLYCLYRILNVVYSLSMNELYDEIIKMNLDDPSEVLALR